jgi:hypothetical protein
MVLLKRCALRSPFARLRQARKIRLRRQGRNRGGGGGIFHARRREFAAIGISRIFSVPSDGLPATGSTAVSGCKPLSGNGFAACRRWRDAFKMPAEGDVNFYRKIACFFARHVRSCSQVSITVHEPPGASASWFGGSDCQRRYQPGTAGPEGMTHQASRYFLILLPGDRPLAPASGFADDLGRIVLDFHDPDFYATHGGM